MKARLILVITLFAMLAGCVQMQGDQIVWGISPIEPGNMSVPTPSGDEPQGTTQGAEPSTPTIQDGHPLEPMGVIGTGEPDSTQTLKINATIDSFGCKLVSTEVDKKVIGSHYPEGTIYQDYNIYHLEVIASGTVTGPVGTGFLGGLRYKMFDAASATAAGFPSSYDAYGGKKSAAVSWRGTPKGFPDWPNTLRLSSDPPTTRWTYTEEITASEYFGPIDKSTVLHFRVTAGTEVLADDGTWAMTTDDDIDLATTCRF